MITITYEKLMAILALFTATCVSVGYMVRIVKGLRKPAGDIVAKLDRDNKRLNKIEEEMVHLNKSVALLVKSDLVVLGHLQTNNNTGEMRKMETEIKEFLIEN